MKSSGQRRHLLSLYRPGAQIPDGDGGFVESWTELSPSTAYGAIEPATARNMERLFSNTIVASATHLVTIPYRTGLRVTTRLIFEGRTFDVVGVQDPLERHIELVLACVEIFDAETVVVPVPWMQDGFVQEELVQ